MAYEEDNYRLHGYVTVLMFKQGVVAGVDEMAYTRQYCGHHASSSVMRLHRYYCKKNPKGQ
ncbi:hypothetical protein DVH05_000838 [Phytophthora capsici]|nr:hypothetical protein DVH05_000838 [Phytophthora capsici]